jgi:hypothetical protein
MDIHLPKVPHSWREFGREIGIIVLGVLIALFFEQLAQARDWKEKVRAADEAMRSELLLDDGPEIYMDAVIHPCVVSRLDSIRSAVDSGQSRSDISKLIDQFWTPFFTYDSNAQAMAQTSQVSLHFEPERLARFTQVYSSMPLMDQTNILEARDDANLRAFRRSGGALSDTEADALLRTVEALRNDDRVMWGGAKFTLPAIRSLGTIDLQSVHENMALARKYYGGCVRDLPTVFPANMSPDG